MASASAFHFSKAHLSNIPGLDKVLKNFVDEAKRRKLDCGVKPYQFEAFVLACLWGKPQKVEFCDEIKDTRGPYSTKEKCKIRVICYWINFFVLIFLE